MSAFASLLGVADATLDTTFSEAFSFTPMREVRNGSPVVDTSRSAIASLAAIFDDRGLLLALAPGAASTLERQSAGPMISVLASHLPQGVRRPDRFTRGLTGRAYEVRAVDPDALGRIVLTLAELPA